MQESIGSELEAEEVVQMSDILYHMYASKQIDEQHVSVNSAFICMLHLANEKNLEFVPSGLENDFRVLAQ